MSAPAPVCKCCGKATFLVMSDARGWCPVCEAEFRRVLVYLEAVAKIARYAMAKRG